MAKKFQAGDVVQLKSGGPEMTGQNYDTIVGDDLQLRESDSRVVCQWFAGNDLKNATFNQDSLEKID